MNTTLKYRVETFDESLPFLGVRAALFDNEFDASKWASSHAFYSHEIAKIFCDDVITYECRGTTTRHYSPIFHGMNGHPV